MTRENELQNRALKAEDDVKYWKSRVMTDGEVEYWKEAFGRLATGECLNCGDQDPHRLGKAGG